MVDFLLALLVSGPETTPAMMTLVIKFLTDNPFALALVKEPGPKNFTVFRATILGKKIWNRLYSKSRSGLKRSALHVEIS
ncbi:hypothetical protein KSP40_PGU004257 [Platanthera guangdongensis]|uniref:Uncharacterized protein n=1 Tax=Platanthera guangdongensis TaxID=2320717 RepID=A0ABR2LE82_9ASPA